MKPTSLIQMIVLLLMVLLLSACGAVFPTATPYPTYTPFPTQTPNPTYTPIPPTPTSTATLTPSPTRPPTASPTPTLSPTPISSPTPAISPTPLPPPKRMENGFFFTAKPRGAYNYINVSNPSPLDAVVAVTRDNVLATAVYIQAGRDFKIEAIPVGTYTFYFVLGEDWNHPERQFTRKVEYHRFAQTMGFSETPWGGGIQYSYWTVTLASTGTSNLNPSDFPPLPK